MKIRQVGAELFHENRRIDRRKDGHDEANSRFSKFLWTRLITNLIWLK